MSNLGNKITMAKNITYYMEKNNKTRSEMSEILNVPYTTFTDWIKAKTYPRIDKIEMMSNYFGISKADLVEERPITENDDGLSEKKRVIIEKIKYMDDEHIDALNQLVDSILRLRKK